MVYVGNNGLKKFVTLFSFVALKSHHNHFSL